MVRRRPLVVELGEIGAGDAALVGRKASRLAALLRGGFPVPAGFCLTTAATGAWSEAAREALIEACRQLGGRVSVRSSALEEDADGASYAGIYHSELPIEGEDAIVAAVERCLAAWHAPEARAYRELHGDGLAPVMAIIVQRLVEARAAGVAYTRDPLAPEKREVHLNSVWGLGEPLAAGRADGDTMALSRRGRLLRQRLATKTSELTPHGTRPVGGERREAASLSLAQARRVMLLALAAERHFGAPQDVEFAFEGEQLWILQSRPLVHTSTGRELERYLAAERRRLARRWRELRDSGRLRGAEMVLSNGNIGELLPSPSAISFGLFRRIFAGRHGAIARGRARLGYRFDPGRVDYLYELVAGQAYFNLEIDAATFDIGGGTRAEDYLQRAIDQPELANYPEVHLYGQHDGPADRAAGDFRRGMLEAGRRWIARFADGVPQDIVFDDRRDWHGLDAAACAKRIGALISRLRRGPCVVFVEVARLGFYFAARVHRQLLARLGADGGQACARLLTGLPGSIVTQQALDLEALAEGRLARDEFLRRYGHTATNELELSEPRLAEQPARLAAMLAELRQSGRRPADEFARQQRERAAAEAALLARLRRAGAPVGEIDELLAELQLAQALLPLRETVKHHYTAVHAEIRCGLLQLAGRLDWPPERIFDLRPGELAAAARDPRRLRAIAERRAGERRLARRAAHEGRLPAVILGSRPEALGRLPEVEGADARQGSALAPGRRRGIARVAGEDGSLPALNGSGDEILVLRAANLGIAPMLRTVAGLVVEVGGLLAHSACQAREAGIPAVALPNATRLIADGSEIVIDGGAGRVTQLGNSEGDSDDGQQRAAL